jgi:pimeloyl-ACP methyl ester carboxylesterase
VREQHIQTQLGKLAVYELGSGPATMLWPSLYVDHASLLPLATELVDGPGHGRSAVPARPYTLWDCGQATEQVLDALSIANVDWIGNAWGGHVGTCVAITSPTRVRTLTTIGTPMDALTRSMRVQTRLGLALLALGARALVGKLIAKAMLSPASAAEHHAYVCRCIRDAPKGGLSRAVHSISLDRPDLGPELPRLRIPTLFIAGADDRMWPPDAARRAAAAVANVHVAVIPASAHLAPLERPVETLAEITAFLDAGYRDVRDA